MFLNYFKIRNYVQFVKHMFYERKVNNDINIINSNGEFRGISNNSYCSFVTFVHLKIILLSKYD